MRRSFPGDLDFQPIQLPRRMVEKVTKMVELVDEWNTELVESVRKVDLV